MDFRSYVAQSIVIEGASTEEIASSLTVPPEESMGDYSLPCFKFSKAMRMSPQAIADKLKATVKTGGFIAKTEVLSGYLNFYLDKQAVAKAVLDEALAVGGNYGASVKGRGKTVCIDYSSVNIAKPFHIGHLSTTAIGGSLYRIFKKLGYNTVGINHLGDWGTQFGNLIAAYLKWGNEAELDKRGINALLDLYVRFSKEAETDKAFEDEGRHWFKKIEDGDAQAAALFARFKDITLKEVSRTYERMGIYFDSYNGESFYNDKMDEVVDILNSKNLLKDSEGAKIVDLGDSMPPCLIRKKDGASLYATRDIAAAIYRKRTYNFDKNLYVVAYQQNLHFKQVFEVLRLAGFEWAKDCIHVPFGMVSLEGGVTLSTRKGIVVFLEDVLDKAVAKTLEVIEAKTPDLENKRQTAEKVGVGAVIFSVLSSSKIKDIEFRYDNVLSFEGETGPYLMYTHARCASVLAKGGGCSGADYSCLTNDDEFRLIKSINGFAGAISDAADKYEPSILTRQIMNIAQDFNKFYFEHKIVDPSDPERTKARLALTMAAKSVLKEGMRLILLDAPDKM